MDLSEFISGTKYSIISISMDFHELLEMKIQVEVEVEVVQSTATCSFSKERHLPQKASWLLYYMQYMSMSCNQILFDDSKL